MSAELRCDALVAEIGSTTTLVNAFDGLHAMPRFLGQGRAHTSVNRGDVLLGLNEAIEDLKARLGVRELTYSEFFATSSATGGLRMSVHGLVPDMTVRAAEAAALGAGAIVHMLTAGSMREADLDQLRKLNPNLILIAGGTDYGERDIALHNARRIAELGLRDIPVIYAGNIQNRAEIAGIFSEKGISLSLCENVYPRLDELNVEPTRRVIQQLFEAHIVKAPGMARIYELITQPLMPTPGAVMAAARLLHPAIGDLAVIDVGGATTDVHSACEPSEAIVRIQTRSEPLYKRSVEGDLGIFLNARHLVELIGEEALSRELGIDIETCLSALPPIPATEAELRLAERLTLQAGLEALRRHAGRLRSVFLPGGRQQIAEGKDLTGCQSLIATGGALTRLPKRREILIKLRDMNHSRQWLYPKPGQMRVLVDRHYILASLGVLGRKYPEAALHLMKESLREEAPCTP